MGEGPSTASKSGQAMSELRTVSYLIDVLAEHGDRQAVLALQKEGAESWSYIELGLRGCRAQEREEFDLVP
jgi:hypothetical protein